jgi:hypothetical protein
MNESNSVHFALSSLEDENNSPSYSILLDNNYDSNSTIRFQNFIQNLSRTHLKKDKKTVYLILFLPIIVFSYLSVFSLLSPNSPIQASLINSSPQQPHQLSAIARANRLLQQSPGSATPTTNYTTYCLNRGYSYQELLQSSTTDDSIDWILSDSIDVVIDNINRGYLKKPFGVEMIVKTGVRFKEGIACLCAFVVVVAGLIFCCVLGCMDSTEEWCERKFASKKGAVQLRGQNGIVQSHSPLAINSGQQQLASIISNNNPNTKNKTSKGEVLCNKETVKLFVKIWTCVSITISIAILTLAIIASVLLFMSYFSMNRMRCAAAGFQMAIQRGSEGFDGTGAFIGLEESKVQLDKHVDIFAKSSSISQARADSAKELAQAGLSTMVTRMTAAFNGVTKNSANVSYAGYNLNVIVRPPKASHLIDEWIGKKLKDEVEKLTLVARGVEMAGLAYSISIDASTLASIKYSATNFYYTLSAKMNSITNSVMRPMMSDVADQIQTTMLTVGILIIVVLTLSMLELIFFVVYFADYINPAPRTQRKSITSEKKIIVAESPTLDSKNGILKQRSNRNPSNLPEGSDRPLQQVTPAVSVIRIFPLDGEDYTSGDFDDMAEPRKVYQTLVPQTLSDLNPFIKMKKLFSKATREAQDFTAPDPWYKACERIKINTAEALSIVQPQYFISSTNPISKELNTELTTIPLAPVSSSAQDKETTATATTRERIRNSEVGGNGSTHNNGQQTHSQNGNNTGHNGQLTQITSLTQDIHRSTVDKTVLKGRIGSDNRPYFKYTDSGGKESETKEVQIEVARVARDGEIESNRARIESKEKVDMVQVGVIRPPVNQVENRIAAQSSATNLLADTNPSQPDQDSCLPRKRISFSANVLGLQICGFSLLILSALVFLHCIYSYTFSLALGSVCRISSNILSSEMYIGNVIKAAAVSEFISADMAEIINQCAAKGSKGEISTIYTSLLHPILRNSLYGMPSLHYLSSNPNFSEGSSVQASLSALLANTEKDSDGNLDDIDTALNKFNSMKCGLDVIAYSGQCPDFTVRSQVSHGSKDYLGVRYCIELGKDSLPYNSYLGRYSADDSNICKFGQATTAQTLLYNVVSMTRSYLASLQSVQTNYSKFYTEESVILNTLGSSKIKSAVNTLLPILPDSQPSNSPRNPIFSCSHIRTGIQSLHTTVCHSLFRTYYLQTAVSVALASLLAILGVLTLSGLNWTRKYTY